MQITLKPSFLYTKGGTGVPKPPRAPEKPLVPYMRYSRKIWDSVRNQNPELKLWEIGKIIGQMWKELADFEKQEFQDEYDLEKQQYDKDLNAYKASPGYLAYVQAKCRGNPVIEDPEPKGVRTAERRIDIQPAEDEEDPDDGLSVKHISHARFTRNHRLINEVFSETMVPDVRSVVTTARMQVLKRQVQSLTMHQKKLEAELTQIEEKYNQKKRKFLDSSEDFSKELKKHCAKVVDESKYNEMVNEQLEKLRMEREERARAGAPTPPSPTPPTDPADTRHVLQPVERGTDNPDSPQDENNKADKVKEHDEKDEKMDVSPSKNINGNNGTESTGAKPVDGQTEGPGSLNNQPEDPPLQYADMSNQKSLPVQTTASAAPFGQNMNLQNASQPQSISQQGRPTTNEPVSMMQTTASTLGPSSVNTQAQLGSTTISQQSMLADEQGSVKPLTSSANNPNAPTDAGPMPQSVESGIATQQVASRMQLENESAPKMNTGAENIEMETTTSISAETNQPSQHPVASNIPSESVASQPVASPKYTEMPSTNMPPSTQPLAPPPVQGIPPSFPPQQQNVAFGQANPAYGSPYGAATNPPGPGYPDPSSYSYPPQGQAGVYPAPDPYAVQSTAPQIEPIAPSAPAVAPPSNNSSVSNDPPVIPHSNPAGTSGGVTTEPTKAPEIPQIINQPAGEPQSNNTTTGEAAKISEQTPAPAADNPVEATNAKEN